ncbi:MAG: hypothetical protein ABH803_04345 [Candidatus Micrarchaeota archaeon]
MELRAQSAFEYVLLVGAALVLITIVLLLLNSFTGNALATIAFDLSKLIGLQN